GNAVSELGDSQRRARTPRGLAIEEKTLGREPGFIVEADDRSHSGRETPQRRIARWDRGRAQDRHRRHSKRHHLRDNDIGIITLPDGRHLAVAAFVSDSAANDDTRDAIIAHLAKAAWARANSLG